MTLLETTTIKAPTLYKTNKTAVTEFKAAMETVKAEQARLIAQRNQASQRRTEIPNEIHKLKQTLSETFEKVERDSLRSTIETLESEYEEVLDVLSLNVPEIIGDKMAELGIAELENQAAAEHSQSAEELASYLKMLTAAYTSSRNTARNLLDQNDFKRTKTDFENTKRFLGKN